MQKLEGTVWATVALGALTFGCSTEQEERRTPADMQSKATVTSIEPTPPVAPHDAPAPVAALSFSKSLRAALQNTHDKTAANAFSDAVLSGKVTLEQYTLMAKQNLVVFDCFADILSKDTTLPEALRDHLLRDLAKITGAFRQDLGLAPDARVADTDILSGTTALTEMLRGMTPAGVATCAYQDIGGNAFGTHDLAEALNAGGINNTAGFTVYTRGEFRELSSAMNAYFTDPGQYQSLIDAATRFYQAHGRMSNSAEFAGS